jgi:simple sugar transport system ATP-binding protein
MSALLGEATRSEGAISVDTIGMTKRFGGFTALDNVSVKIREGTFHALLGENGAGKSTLVKCIMGFYEPTEGSVLIGGRERALVNPRDAHALGLGMVYQHFTLVPSLTGAENFVISREDVPNVIDWRVERQGLDEFLSSMPFKTSLDRPVAELTAGEKQKLEILRQLYLGRRFLILDEPTSVLTPDEADEVLGLLKQMTVAGELTVLMITHKFREVTAFAEEVSVLRRGRLEGSGRVADLSHADMAAMMIGSRNLAQVAARAEDPDLAQPVLELRKVKATDRSGLKTIEIDGLTVHRREIVGVAGVSGNGQKELAEILGGQRPVDSGEVLVEREPYGASRKESRARCVRFIPEEPLRNACAPKMSVAENLAFRTFDEKNGAPSFWLDGSQMRARARSLIERFGVRTTSGEAPIVTLSGGNVQRAVLARELSGEVDLLIAANPCFGLDFSAVADIRSAIVAARNQGTAVLLISEDLDELMELSDRIVVMSEGRIVYETSIAEADVHTIGHYMAGQH